MKKPLPPRGVRSVPSVFTMRASMIAWVMVALLPRAASGDAVYAWGSNQNGELGIGITSNYSLVPVAVPALSSGVTALGGNVGTGYAVKGGAAYGWGTNTWGEIGNGTLATPVATPQIIPSLSSGVTGVAGGYYHGSAIKNGAVLSWGTNNYGQVGDGSAITRLSPVSTIGLSSGVTAIVSGGEPDHSFALKGNAVFAWGYANNFGVLGTGSSLTVTSPVAISSLSSGVTVIATGYNNGAAIRNGSVLAWGANQYGAVGDGTYTERDTPTAVASLPGGVSAIACGRTFMLAVQGGAVYGWGDNRLGQLGNPTTVTTNLPIPILPSTASIVSVAAADNSGYALSTDGSIWVWGYNAHGELGIGNMADQMSPVQLFAPAGQRFTGISAEAYTVLALVAPIPEPASVMLSMCGAFALLRRRSVKR